MLALSPADVQRHVCAADPAGLVPRSVVDSLSVALTAPNALDVRISHQPECGACGRTMSVRTSVSCHILTTQGLTSAEHVALRCRATSCVMTEKLVWANFVSDSKSSHTWVEGTARPDIAMAKPTFWRNLGLAYTVFAKNFTSPCDIPG